eukprot:g8867.t1
MICSEGEEHEQEHSGDTTQSGRDRERTTNLNADDREPDPSQQDEDQLGPNIAVRNVLDDYSDLVAMAEGGPEPGDDDQRAGNAKAADHDSYNMDTNETPDEETDDVDHDGATSSDTSTGTRTTASRISGNNNPCCTRKSVIRYLRSQRVSGTVAWQAGKSYERCNWKRLAPAVQAVASDAFCCYQYCVNFGPGACSTSVGLALGWAIPTLGCIGSRLLYSLCDKRALAESVWPTRGRRRRGQAPGEILYDDDGRPVSYPRLSCCLYSPFCCQGFCCTAARMPYQAFAEETCGPECVARGVGVCNALDDLPMRGLLILGRCVDECWMCAPGGTACAERRRSNAFEDDLQLNEQREGEGARHLQESSHPTRTTAETSDADVLHRIQQVQQMAASGQITDLHDVVLTVHTFAKHHFPDHALFQKFSEEVLQRELWRCSWDQIMQIAWSYSTMREYDEKLFVRLAEVMLRKIDRGNATQLVRTVAAFTHLSFRDDRVLGELPWGGKQWQTRRIKRRRPRIMGGHVKGKTSSSQKQ